MDFFWQLLAKTGLAHLNGSGIVMIVVGLVVIFLALSRKFDPLLLLPLGFGIVVGNMPASMGPVGNLYYEGSAFYYLSFLATNEILPALLFLGIGALTDFGGLIVNPRLALLGGAAQVGVFVVAIGAAVFGLSPMGAGVAGMIAGAHGPAAIYAASALDPSRMGVAAIGAYLMVALAPLIQPPILRLLTTREERLIRMAPPRRASQRMRILFPILGFILGVLFIPAAAVLLGLLFLGNLLRECGLAERLSRTLGGSFKEIVIALLAFSVGLGTTGENFLHFSTLGILILAMVGLALSTGGGILFARLMNRFAQTKINPLIGGAGVPGVAATARIGQQIAQEEDPDNDLGGQALVPNQAGLIALALVAGLFISMLR